MTLQTTWYHGTNSSGLDGILVKGFIPNQGLFGTGVYFSSSLEGARIFGDRILSVQIARDQIHYEPFSNWMKQYPDENSWGRAAALGYPAVAFFYESGEVELVVYVASLIQNVTEWER